MEDAAKRRERLMALRSQAAQTSGAPPPAPLAPALLPDPRFSSSSPPAEAAPTHRFDYYTNPSAAFSSAHNLNKRKSASSSSSSSPAARPHARPNVRPHAYTGPNQPPLYRAPRPAHWSNPAPFLPQPPWTMHPPRSPFPNPSFLRDSSTGPRPSNNPYWNTHSGSRGTAGRGRGFHNRFCQSAYYSKSMVEDPWMELEPIVGKLPESLDVSASASASGSHSWLPESLRNKESTIPVNAGNKYDKKLSLAEYLDLSINQTVDET